MTTPSPVPRQASGPRHAAAKPRTASEAGGRPNREDLWRAYELAQRHYELDLQLFSTRMNLFLLIQSGLVALTGGAGRIVGASLAMDRTAVAVFGLALAAGWLVVAVSSYMWVKTWRVKWIELGELLSAQAGPNVASALFDHGLRQNAHKREYGQRHGLWKQLEAFSWLVRPTLVSCCLPFVFMIGWIYLGWLA
jgi:hypothetical protein